MRGLMASMSEAELRNAIEEHAFVETDTQRAVGAKWRDWSFQFATNKHAGQRGKNGIRIRQLQRKMPEHECWEQVENLRGSGYNTGFDD